MSWVLEMFEYYQDQLEGYEKEVKNLKGENLKLRHEIMKSKKNIIYLTQLQKDIVIV